MNWRYWRIFRWTWPRGDVRRYGAIPDGKTDCTAAIQQAVNTKACHLPPGTYFLSKRIQLP
jgi:polygalacturonase